MLAWVIICHALTRFPQKTVCTAPTTQQLFDALAAETKAWFKKLPTELQKLFEIKSDQITHTGAPDESFISFRTSRPEMPEALAGVHSENVLLIGDEASGIPESVYVAASGSMSGHNAITILAGNPVRSNGLFFETHMGTVSGMWRKMHISCVNHPRVTPDFVEEMKARYGEDTNDYRVRVLGEFPKEDADSVIPFELIQLAKVRDVKPTNTLPIWGLDCARYGGDRSCLVKRTGNVVLEPAKVWKGLDMMELAGRVHLEWKATPLSQRPSEICIDAIGIGAGTADRLRELGLPARAVNVAESPAFGDQYVNLRAELYFLAKEWFVRRDSFMVDHALAAELGWPRFGYTSSAKIKVEGKVEMKKRFKKSPDLADAFVLTFAATAISALHGSAGSGSWNEALKRPIKGI